MRSFALSIFLPLTFLVTCVPFVASPSQQQNQSDQTIRIGTELVVLDAQVLSKKTGLAVGGLSKEDFVVFEDGVKQYITHFSQDKLPLSVVILLDVTSSVDQVKLELNNTALEVLRHLKPQDEVALMEFAARARLVRPFVLDRQLIVEGIRQTSGKGIGDGTYINQAVYQAADYLTQASSPSTRRVIIAITDDVSVQPQPLVPPKSAVLSNLFESGSTVAGLIFNTLEKRDGTFQTGRMSTSIFDRPVIGLVRSYSDETGGVCFDYNPAELALKFAQLIDQLRSRYSLGYISSNQKRDGKFRRIKIEISTQAEKREGRIAVKTRRGYYAR